jgi:hypothetical protein
LIPAFPPPGFLLDANEVRSIDGDAPPGDTVFSEQITIFAAVREETAGLEFIHHTPVIEVSVTESSHSSPSNSSALDSRTFSMSILLSALSPIVFQQNTGERIKVSKILGYFSGCSPEPPRLSP